jgi:hypothetical protein
MLNYFFRISSFSAIVVCVSCVEGSLDLLGEEAAVTELKKNASAIEDDRVADKHVEYDPARFVEEKFGDFCTIHLNKSASITKLDIVSSERDDDSLKDKVFPSRPSAIAAINELVAERTSQFGSSLIPSIEVVNGAMKPFNDGLYAAIEISVEEGLEVNNKVVFPSKRLFLHKVLAGVLRLRETAEPSYMQYLDAAAIDLAAALILAEQQPELPAGLIEQAQEAATDFLDHSLYSRPIGFYTWSPTLEEIFSQDRFLQNYQVEYSENDGAYSLTQLGKAAALALAIDTDPELQEDYQKYLALYRGMTNPFMDYPVTDLVTHLAGITSLGNMESVRASFIADHPSSFANDDCNPHFALFPASRSKQTAYFESQYCEGAPSDLNYLDELINAIRQHFVDLEPAGDSGWYDYQSYALESLLLPERGEESDHLLLTKAYKKKLVETFKTIIIQNRETHAKQLGMSSSKGGIDMEVDLYPLFPVEPFATFYLRSARAYRFLGPYLSSILGAEFLKQSHRMFEDDTSSDITLEEELGQKTELLYGLYFLAADSVGLKAELMQEELEELSEQTCRDRALQWLTSWQSDRDVLSDMRVIVPVNRDFNSNQTIYWATLGIKAVKARAEFAAGYEPRDISGCWTGEFVPHDYYLMGEVSAEVRLPLDTKPPTREELRRICDRYDNVTDIVNALQKP